MKQNENKKEIRVRFAPSPTGYLHIGNARTALFNWLFAKKNNGKFILRIEDTDNLRSKQEYFESIIEDLYRFGLDWDEGPDVGGSFGPYKQSQRIGIYEKYLKILVDKGIAYECYCLPEELEEMRKKLKSEGKNVKYTGKCRNLTDEEKRKLRAEGRKPSYRFKVPEKEIVFEDLIKGEVSFDMRTIGDFIIMKSDGWPAFHFAVAVDDGEMKITNVIRGDDHLTNTPKHILIMEALGFDIPEYAHLPMICGYDGQPLSKRHGHVSLREFFDEGYLPEGLLNYLALLGWSPGDNKEIFTKLELIKKFSLKNVKKSSAIFDIKKLDWINSQHIKEIPDVKLAQMILPYVKSEEAFCSRKSVNEDMFAYLKKMVKVLKPYLTKLSDVNKFADIFLCKDVEISDEAADVIRTDVAKNIFRVILENIDSAEILDEKEFGRILKIVKEKTSAKGKALFQPIRAALTGRLSGPELVDIFPLLDKNTIKSRLEKALNFS